MSQLERVVEAGLVDRQAPRTVDGAKAIERIQNFAVSWAKAKPPTRAALIQSVYEEVVVRGEEFVTVRLTPEAYAHGLALALPREVVVPALPTWGDLGADQIWHWRARQDSNLRPSAPEADALSTELQARDADHTAHARNDTLLLVWMSVSATPGR